MSVYQPITTTLGRVLSLLENLKRTGSGAILYQHIEESFHQLETSRQETERFYLGLLDTLLSSLAHQLAPGSEQRMQIFILQKSLRHSPSQKELEQFQQQIQQLLGMARDQAAPAAKTMQDTFNSLINEINHTHDGYDASSGIGHIPDADLTPEAEAPFCYIDQTRNNIQTIQTSLTDQINNAKEFNAALAKLLHSSFAAVRNLEASDDIEEVKNNFLRRYAKLIKMQQELASKFQSIDDSLSAIESNSQNLNEELTRVHRLSLTDELTQLPNRRAFLMRLDDEISRALRFNYPLTLALIDIDNFKPINDTYGHAAGDQILCHLAENMNVVFRYHDMAARYGGEEFAVLFPNTNINGAHSALAKLQQQMKLDPFILSGSEEVPVPTFSAGIALYNPGEDADELIKRADNAMYQAKAGGRDKIEIDPFSQEREKDLPQSQPGIA